MSKSQAKADRKKIAWQSQSNSYEQNALALKMAHESFAKNTKISLENSLSERESRIIKKSIKLTEMAKNAQPLNQSPDKRYKNIQDLIINDFKLEEEKYAQFDSPSEHSSEDETKMEVTDNEIDDMIDSVKKEPQNGKITFISKLIKNQNSKEFFRVVKIRGLGNILPQVHQIRNNGSFGLYEIETNSYLKKIVIELVVENQVIARSREIPFAPRQILLDLELSYNFKRNAAMKINMLEGILASCVLQGDTLTDEIIQLNGKREFKAKIIKDGFTLDQETISLIRENKNTASILKLLKLLLEEQKWEFGIPSKYITSSNPSYLILAQIFIEESLKFKPAVGREDRQELAIEESVRLVELFIHFICLIELKARGISIAGIQNDVRSKLDQFIHFAFQVSEVKIYHQLIQLCISRNLSIVPQGYDTIKDYITNYSLSSSEFLLTHLENIYYNINVKKVKANPIILFLDIFQEKKFENNNVYEKQLPSILNLSNLLFQQMDIDSAPFALFIRLFKTYWNFRENHQLVTIIRSQYLRNKIHKYIQNLKEKMQRVAEKQRASGVIIIEMYYITFSDDQLPQDVKQFKALVSYLIERTRDQNILELVIKLYFEIFKRTPRIFSLELLKEITNNLSSASSHLSRISVTAALTIINKYFNEDYLQSEDLINICNDNLLKPLILRLIPESNYGAFLTRMKENHNQWHNEFHYQSHINEQILERMTRIIQKHFGNDKLGKNAYLDIIKREITNIVDDEDKKGNLLAIIEFDMLSLDTQHVWIYFTEKRSYLKILIKVLKKEEEAADILRDSLRDINGEIRKKQVSFEKIQKIKSMKANQWHHFVELTNDYEMPTNIDNIYETGNAYLTNIKKLQDFVRDVGVKFTSPNYLQICGKLQDLTTKYIFDKIGESKIEDELPIFKNFNSEILNCYKLKPFFSENLSNRSIEDIIKACNQLLTNLKRKAQDIYKNYDNDSLNSQIFYFFQPNKNDIKEFRSILTMIKKQNIPPSLEEIINIYTIIAEADEYFKYLHAFTTIQQQKFDVITPELVSFVKICDTLIQKKPIKVKDLQSKLNKVHEKLKDFKLDWKQNKQIFEILAHLTENQQKFAFFRQFENALKDMKDEVSEAGGGEVTYEQIQDCEITIEFLKEVYEPESKVTFPQFITAIFDYINTKSKGSKSFNLSTSLKTSFSITKQLKEQKANLQDNTRNTVKFIDEIIKRVKFQFSIDNKNKDKVVTLTTIYPSTGNQEFKIVEERDLYANKEKAIMICCANDEKQKQQRKKELDNFLQIIKVFQQLKEQEVRLTEWGFRQFVEKNIVIEIINSDLGVAQQLLYTRQKQLDEWRREIKRLYEINFKAAFLQGKKLKQFYDFITNPSFTEIPTSFLIINENVEIHKQILRDLSMNSTNSKFKGLSIIFSYFQQLKSKVVIEPALDRDQNFLHFKIMPKGEIDFIKGIQEIGSQRIEKLKFDKLLICTPQTSNFQIKSFIERALRDLDSQYIVLGYQNLDRRKQQLIVDEIKNYQAQYGTENLKLKLCLVGDSELELLYKFTKEELKQSPAKTENIETIKAAYQNKLRKECQRIKIVYSSMAGIGKTTFIKRDSLERYQCTEQYYLPLSGVMAVPVESNDDDNHSLILQETQKFLWDRSQDMMNYFKQCQRENRKSCLVIQIYNIENSVIDMINKFLQSILFFKSHQYRTNNGEIPKHIPIYIELQNISPPAFTRVPENLINLPPQMRILPFLRELKSVCGQKIIKVISEFKTTDIAVTPADKELNYILYHLKLFKSGEINTKSVQPYATYQVQNITEEQGRNLAQEYFFSNFNEADAPSGYLWTYFRSLLFEATKNFSSSYFLMLPTLREFDQNIYQANKALHAKMNLKLTFRLEFYKVIINNSIQFIQRSVKPGHENTNSEFNQKLFNLPFLIIPNVDGDSFSFIYNNSNNVPEVIKSMIVLQTPSLFQRIINISIEKLFEEENITVFEKKPQSKGWIERASQILANISGNRLYQIDCEKGYVVNIDNFFKMCLIVQRVRLNIPIVIMGEAGIGKTALLRHVVNHLFKHQFAVFNINAGLPLESKKSQIKGKNNDSLAAIVENIQTLYKKIQEQNKALQNPKDAKKLWVFFDEFNTLRELGFFKEIIIDGRYLGKEQPHVKNVIMMAACNPHRELRLNANQRQEQHVREQTQRLAFDVLPAPHSLMECMWNYGGLTAYENEKYIGKMLTEVKYKNQLVASTILKIHEKIELYTFASAVSLRDIDRFRQLYRWFQKNLPRRLNVPINPLLEPYNNIQQRAFILACYFTYILRFDVFLRKQIEKHIEGAFGFPEGYLLAAKETEEDDLCSRLNFNWDAPIAVNSSLKQNIYSCFVCINIRLPLLIIGAPGCSKSLSLRILAKNLKERQNDEYLKSFKKMRQYPIQGSENTTTDDIKTVFEKAYDDFNKRNRGQTKEISVVIFDEIGLAEKSKDNPLKVLHPYLEVNRQENLEERVLSFIGISNSELDVSKMSRLLVLRRPPANLDDLTFTALNIAAGYRYGKQNKIKYILEKLTLTYSKFLSIWKLKKNNYPLFFGLRDFYGLVKIYMSKLAEREVDMSDDAMIIQSASDAIFQNFQGWTGTYQKFKEILFEELNQHVPVSPPTMKETLQSILKTLDKESLRYPLVIVDDHESLCYVKWIIQKRYPHKSIYMQGSPFVQDKEYSLKLLGEICRYMQNENALILTNLSEGVKTGLYDFFNKSFSIRASNNNKYLRIRTQSGSLNQMQYLYNEKFNCVYLLLEKNLQEVEPPFLSRFQKYRFSLTEYRQELSINILSKLQKFMQKLEQICKNNKLEHFKISNLFINVNENALQSLVVAAYESGGEEHAYKQALRRLIMNSGQYFFKIYKHFIEPKGDLPEIREIMQQAIQSKNNGSGDRNLIIRFTNDKNYTKKFTDKSIVSAEFVTFKKETDFDEELSKFFKSKTKSTLYISLNVFNESIFLNYVTSQIEKIHRRALAENEHIQEKKVRLLYIFDNDKEEAKPSNKSQRIQRDVAITHFTKYRQEFDDGRLDEIKNVSKKELFNNVIKIDSLFAYVHRVFDISFDCEDNAIKAQAIFTKLAQSLYSKKDGLLSKQAQDITLFLEQNLELSEDVIKEMLLDQQITKSYKNYREALTKYFADKKLLGALAVFLKYLFEKQAFMAYGSQEMLEYLEEINNCKLDFELTTLIIEAKSRANNNYHQLVNELIDFKKQFIAKNYRDLKMIKRLPTIERKFAVKITRPRLIPFSKGECELILDCNQKKLGWYIKQIYLNDEKQEKDRFDSAFKIYEEQFKKKTTFASKQRNFYSYFINEDKSIKTMLFLDLLSDFCEERGLALRYLGKFYRIISQFFSVEVKDNKKNKVERAATFPKMASILLGYEEIWVQIFKVCQTIYDEGLEFGGDNLQQERVATRGNLKKYIQSLYTQIKNLLLGANILTTFKNPERYTPTFVNVLFQLQKLQVIIDSPIPDQLKSTRTTLVFIEMFDSSNKGKHIQSFMVFKSKIQNNVSHYQNMFNYFQGLKENSSKEQQDKITQFQANQLFYQWFKQEPENRNCMEQFIHHCNRDETFAHNSVATINLFLATSYNRFGNIETCFNKYNAGKEQDLSKHLKILGEQAKSNNYKSNLAILITNIFIQKISIESKNETFIKQADRTFETILNKIINSEGLGIATLYAFAYFKIYLKQYITLLVNKNQGYIMSRIDDLLSSNNNISKNLRFYCLKLLRTLKPIKQIKEEYIKTKKVKWIEPLTDLFHEEASRSISVPNDTNINASPKMLEIIDEIIKSHGGQVDLFDALIQEANSPYNRYALLNFFMRYYFSMSYNQKQYRNTVLQKLNASKEKYTQKIGEKEFELILRYASSKFDENLKIETASEFKQDLFLYFNSLNWLIASRLTSSPFHSYFFRDGQFHVDFTTAYEGFFFPCGPENDFIGIAEGIYGLTRNNNIGVYLCSGQCDYIYCHEDCGWPNQQSTCPICSKAIGCKPGKGHTVNRIQEGAKRVNSPTFTDKGGKFYVYSMTGQANYWQMQRNYIQAEINRMKLVKVAKVGQRNVKLTGFEMQNNGRISTLSYYIFRQNINSIFYCLLGLGIITEQQSAALFKGKNIASARSHFLEQTQADLDFIKKALTLDSKIYGWMFGIHKIMYKTLIHFNDEFRGNLVNITDYSNELARKLDQDITEKKVAADYAELYRDMAGALRKGLLTKEISNIFDMSAANRFTRDFLESKVESFIKTYTTMDKFGLAEENGKLQGKMQFPKDVILTEDELKEQAFELSRILKIPDREIKYNEIVINYELNIRENYPFLDYILKNSDSIISMLDFYQIIAFSNELAKEVENNYERKDANRSIKSFLDELWDKKQERLHEILRNPKATIESWNRLSKKLGALQTECVPVGKMGEYSLQTPIQAFLVELITKQNLFGLTIASILNNFAKLHNDLVVILNSRKNQIAQYKCLNLYNESKKVHPQKLQESDVFIMTQKQLVQKLYENSISSINYGRNFIFNNFDSYQHYFLMKLLGKCEIISDTKKFKNICYNGEAFAQTSESSNTITEVREYFYEELTREEVKELQGIIGIQGQGDKGRLEEYVVRLRGDLEKIMIAIRNLNGFVEAKNLGDFVHSLKFDEITYELKSETFGKFQVSKIVHFYEVLELELKPVVIDKLPERYKQSMDEQTQREIRELLNELPLESEYSVTLVEFGHALYRFISRILQGGVQQNDKALMLFLMSRSDFWAKDFEDYKLEALMNNEKMMGLTYAFAGQLFEMVERLTKKKQTS